MTSISVLTRLAPLENENPALHDRLHDDSSLLSHDDIAYICRQNATVWLPILGALVGSWFGATFIPLDWDRPWQVKIILCRTMVVLDLSVTTIRTAGYHIADLQS
jgi:hypothetical protein